MTDMTEALDRAATETAPARTHEGRENDRRLEPNLNAGDWDAAFARAARKTA